MPVGLRVRKTKSGYKTRKPRSFGSGGGGKATRTPTEVSQTTGKGRSRRIRTTPTRRQGTGRVSTYTTRSTSSSGGKAAARASRKAARQQRRQKRQKRRIKREIKQRAQAVKRYSQKVKEAKRPDLSKLDYLDKQTVKQGKKYNVAPSLLASQQEKESGRTVGGPTSSAGAFGVSQFIPSTARTYGVKPGTSKSAVKSQVRGQAKYMHDLGAKGKDKQAFAKATGGYYGALTSDYYGSILSGASKYKKLDRVSTKPNRQKLRPAKKKLKKAATKLETATERAKKAGIRKVKITEGKKAKPVPVKRVKRVVAEAKKAKPVMVAPKRPKKSKPAAIQKIGAKAQKKFGVSLSEGPGKRSTSPVPSSGHAPSSYHYQGAAYDITGTPEQLSKTYTWLAKKYGGDLEELFYDPAGEYIKDGQVVQGQIGGHGTHIHVAETKRARTGAAGIAAQAAADTSGMGAWHSSVGGSPATGGTATSTSDAGSATASAASVKRRRRKRRSRAEEETERKRAAILAMLGDSPAPGAGIEDALKGFQRHEESYAEYAKRQ